MAKIPIKGASWLLVMQAAMAAREHWGVLSRGERSDLARLLRTTRGRPANLTDREKSELKRLVGKLDLPGLGKEFLPFASNHGGRRRR